VAGTNKIFSNFNRTEAMFSSITLGISSILEKLCAAKSVSDSTSVSASQEAISITELLDSCNPVTTLTTSALKLYGFIQLPTIVK